MKWKLVWMTAALGALGAGCDEGGVEETVTVAPYLRDCNDGYLCMAGNGTGWWKYGIEGFTFQWGTTTKLSMMKYPTGDPGPDVADSRYELLEVISQTPDPIGTTYRIEHLDPLERLYSPTASPDVVSLGDKNKDFLVACDEATCTELVTREPVYDGWAVTLTLTGDAEVPLRAVSIEDGPFD